MLVTGRRFRIFDLHTPWFWVVSFYLPRKAPCLTVELFDERFRFRRGEHRWWFHALAWEDEPDQRPMEAIWPDRDEWKS